MFDGRKDAQERNRELRNSEKALSKVFRVLKKLEAGDSTSAAAFSQIRQLAQNNTEFSAFARDLFNLDEKTSAFDFADYDGGSGGSGSDNFVLKREDESRGSVSWSNISPAQTGGSGSTVRQSICFRRRDSLTDRFLATLISREQTKSARCPYERYYVNEVTAELCKHASLRAALQCRLEV